MPGQSGTATNLIELEQLQQISRRLAEKAPEFGVALCLCARNKGVAVGTSLGAILIFDHEQTLVAVLASSESTSWGAITALDLAFDSTWILAGHQTGVLTVWDVADRRPVHVLQDHHEAITHVAFLPDKLYFLSADVRGVVRRAALTYVSRAPSRPLLAHLLGGPAQLLHV